MLCGKPQNNVQLQAAVGMPVESWQLRVIEEKEQLNAKITNLAGFLASEQFPTLDQAEQDRLTRQLAVMQEYRSILAARIEAWNPAVES